jgi:hypothetical protein
VAEEDVSRRMNRKITRGESVPQRRIRKTGSVRRRIEPPLSPVVRRERAARTKQILTAVEKLLPEIPAEQLGGATPKQLLARLKALLERIEIEKYATARLLKSKGLKWSWFGEVWEEVIASNQKLWNELGGYAGVELKDLNEIIKKNAAAGLLNGRGEPVASMETQLPGRFPPKVEMATDVRLVPKGGQRTDRGRKYTDRMLVSFQGKVDDRWMANALNAEIKVPKKKGKFGKQSAEAIPRMVEGSFLKMLIVDIKTGEILRSETVAVEQVVINPVSTTRFGLTARGGKGRTGERIEPISGRARRFKETHLRYELEIPTTGAQKIIDTIFSRKTLAKK